MVSPNDLPPDEDEDAEAGTELISFFGSVLGCNHVKHPMRWDITYIQPLQLWYNMIIYIYITN